MLNLVHHKDAFQRTQVLNGSQYVQHELLVIFHVRCMNLEQIVKAAGDVIAFGHFRDSTDDLCELLPALFPG